MAMFYSEAVLSRRGPLGRVWLAAHMERKLSKSQTLQTDIEQSVDAIMGHDIEVMALRLSGQLLLGVVRIYSRKAKYLLDDCNDALLKIKMAFRPGVVDLTEDQLNVNKTTITLQANTVDLDLLLPDINWSQLTNNEDSMSVDGSVGVGRDAASNHSVLDFPHLNGISKGIDIDMQSFRSISRDPSEQPFQPAMDLDFPDFGGMDLGDLGIGFDQAPEVVSDVAILLSTRDSSPLTEIPDTPVAEETLLPEIPEEPKVPKKPREKKQIIDSVTELYEGPGASRANEGPMKDVSNIITEQHYLPRSTLAMKLQEIRSDPLGHFLPTKTVDNHLFFSAGPPGLADDLVNLFLRPVEANTQKRRYVSVTEDGNKRIRLEDEVEEGRRAMSVAGSVAAMSDWLDGHNITGDFEFADQTAPLDDYQLELPLEDGNVELELPRGRSTSAAPSGRSRHSTPGGDGWLEGEESYADVSCPIAMFDRRQPTQTQTQDDQDIEPAEEAQEEKGYSKNTVKALAFIRKELQPVPEKASAEDTTLSFNSMATKASRRAAASFFFELLVLGTRDCVKLSQSGAFKDIEVGGKPKLWQAQKHVPAASV